MMSPAGPRSTSDPVLRGPERGTKAGAADDDAGVLAIEIGAARLTAAVVGRDGFVRHSRHRRTPFGTEAALGDIGQLAVDVAAKSTLTLAAAGVALAADVDVDRGVVRHSGELGWHNVHLAEAVRAAVGVPVVVDRSVRAAALAEGVAGAGAGATDWLYLQLDDDIHSAAVVRGVLQRGTTSGAGEVGHLPVYPFGLVCTCGQRGCVQAYASVAVIRRRYRELSRREASVAQIAARFGRDPLADEVWRTACDAIGLALAMYTLIQDPQVIVLSGVLTDGGSSLLSAVGETLRDRLSWREPPRLALARADQPVVKGAALLAWSALT